MPFYILVSLVSDIILNTLTFKFLAISGTQILAYGSLILLQLPLHIFILRLNGKNIGLLLLMLIVSGLTLHYSFFIEIHSNELTQDKLPKNIIAEINICFMNLNIFILFRSFSLNTYECLQYHQHQ